MSNRFFCCVTFAFQMIVLVAIVATSTNSYATSDELPQYIYENEYVDAFSNEGQAIYQTMYKKFPAGKGGTVCDPSGCLTPYFNSPTIHSQTAWRWVGLGLEAKTIIVKQWYISYEDGLYYDQGEFIWDEGDEPIILTRQFDSCSSGHVWDSLRKICRANQPPSARITTTPGSLGQVYVGRNVTISGTATDSDLPAQSLTYYWALEDGSPATASGLNKKSVTAKFTSPGTKTVELYVNDTGDDSLTSSLDLTVLNHPPTISGVAPSLIAYAVVGVAFNGVTPVAQDLDLGFGDSLTFGLSQNPAWLTIDPATGALHGTPTASDVGESHPQITVKDTWGASASVQFTLRVDVSNKWPTISGFPPYAKVNAPFSFLPVVFDAEGDALTFQVVNAPSWLSWTTSATSIAFSGTPGAGDEGVSPNVTIRVTDNVVRWNGQVHYVELTFDLVVQNFNREKNHGFGACDGTSPLDNTTNPINGSTGNKYQVENDYLGFGPLPLVFQRHYNSLLTDNFKSVGLTVPPTFLGMNWRHTYDRSLKISAQEVKAIRADGIVATFKTVAGVWVADSNNPAQLRPVSGGWEFVDEQDVVEKYDTSGRLNRITDRSGFSLILTYVSGKLQSVTDHFGRNLQFVYNSTNGLLQQIKDPAGKVINFVYIADGKNNFNLQQVIYQDSRTRKYSYENSGFVNALTGIDEGKQGLTLKRYATFGYDLSGRAFESKHAGDANKATLVYQSDGTTLITDALGEARTWHFQTIRGVAVKRKIVGSQCSSCGGAAASSVSYDANGYIDRMTDFNGNVTDYDYNQRGLPTKVIQALGAPEQRVITTIWHESQHIPVCVIEPTRTAALEYNSAGQVLFKRSYDTTDASFTTDAAKTCVAISARADKGTLNQRVIGYSYYDAGIKKGLLRQVDGPLPTDPLTGINDLTTYDYDGVTGNLISITNALNHVTTIQKYDGHGRPSILRDANGLWTEVNYDERGRRTKIQVGQGSYSSGAAQVAFTKSEVISYQYDNFGNLDLVTFPNGAFVDYSYDGANRLIDIFDKFGNQIHYNLDGLGNVIAVQVKDPSGTLRRSHSYLYNSDGRLSQSKGALRGDVSYDAYDGNGNLKTMSDASGVATRFDVYDALNRLRQVTNADGGVVQYDFNVQGSISNVIDPNNLATSYAYDGLGNLKSLQSPDTGATQFTAYDAAGNLKSVTDVRNKTTAYNYDALGRVVEINYNNTSKATYAYDEDPLDPATKNRIGRLRTVTDSTGSTTWSYDPFGRVDVRTQITESKNFILDYNYDAAGQPETIQYPSGNTLKYIYDRGRVVRVDLNAQTLIGSLRYDPFGPLTGWTWGGSAATVMRKYDEDGQLERYSDADVDRELIYQPNGLIKAIHDMGDSRNHLGFTYDRMYRLGSVSPPNYKKYAKYDKNGNRTAFYGYPLKADSVYDKSNPNRLVRSYWPNPDSDKPSLYKDYTYDQAGNTTGDGIYTYDYDDRGRLVSSRLNSLPLSVKYAINAQGQRVSKEVAYAADADGNGVVDASDRASILKAILTSKGAYGNADCNTDNRVNVQDFACLNIKLSNGPLNLGYAKVSFVYDDAGHLIGEYDALGNVIQEHVWFGDLPIAVVRSNGVYRVYADHLNTPRSITDSTGKVVWRWKNEPFVSILPDEDPDKDGELFTYNLRFPGQYYDKETDLHYNYHRTYDPKTGRYLEADPIGLEGGLNVYAYASNNPIGQIDPLGLFESSPYLRATMPGQVSFDNGMTAVENGSYISATAYFGAMLAEQTLAVLTLGQSQVARVGTQCAVSVARGKGLQTPEKFFGNKTYKEAEEALTNKFGPPRGGGEYNKSFFNEKTKRTYNLHQDPMHRGGKPHVDIRKRDLPTDYYKDRPFFLKEGQ